MRTFLCIAALLAFVSSASAAGHGGFHGGGMHGGGFHGAFHGGAVHGFGGGGFHGHRGFGGFARPGGFWIDGVWCSYPEYYAGMCSPD